MAAYGTKCWPLPTRRSTQWLLMRPALLGAISATSKRNGMRLKSFKLCQKLEHVHVDGNLFDRCAVCCAQRHVSDEFV
ncbi:hypothetical protein HBI56_034300 [Parastagonospora nodorum]|nr:hypothetical protein HBH52_001330 [Parastagonospora nodorum]KAH4007146.1 hypothetical protein HBI10_012320 [Parastagonospora nodorum]KAH4011491.1 hypothetical protein HBI13_198270 [Parastagonospora nodorum]KAH4034586.1 hypothetical protein HBI09_100730 [Parastagonospora nodorum]KAH4074513.1 hypothetical protein HBH50_026400 [Parastagonospora nodorum]